MSADGRPTNRAQRRHPETLDAEELAARLGVSTWTVYESARRGDCPVRPIKVGRRLVWPKAQVDRLLGLHDEGPAEAGPVATSAAVTTPPIATADSGRTHSHDNR